MSEKNGKPLDALPALNVSLPTKQAGKEIVQAEQLVGYYQEIFENIREDRQEVSVAIKDFQDMVLNGEESTAASKEALVNLLKIKSEMADKKTKVLDLLVRAFLKEKDTFPRYLAATQNNNFDSGTTRALLKRFEQQQRNKETDEQKP